MNRKNFLTAFSLFFSGVIVSKLTSPFQVNAQVKDNVEIDETSLIKKVLLASHPIGSYYVSEDSTSPSELFGGQWEALEDGCTIVACSSNAGTKGGANSIKLSSSQIPTLTSISGSTIARNGVGSTNTTGNHSHKLNNDGSGQGFWLWRLDSQGEQNIGAGGSAGRVLRNDTTANGNHSHNLNIPELSFNNGKFINNNQSSVDITNKHITAYVWKRIA